MHRRPRGPGKLQNTCGNSVSWGETGGEPGRRRIYFLSPASKPDLSSDFFARRRPCPNRWVRGMLGTGLSACVPHFSRIEPMELFQRTIHPFNCDFLSRDPSGRFLNRTGTIGVHIEHDRHGVWRLHCTSRRVWRRHRSYAGLSFKPSRDLDPLVPRTSLELTDEGSLSFAVGDAAPLLESLPGKGIGLGGTAWTAWLRRTPEMKFYGMGEKSNGLEKSNAVHTFWNVDDCFVHCGESIRRKHFDPDYISIPYVIVKRGEEYAGILIDSSFRSVIGISDPRGQGRHFMNGQWLGEPSFFCGAEDGAVSLFFLYGPSLPELTRKFAALTGTMERPPLWSLGYHQCRWGYKSSKDLRALTRAVRRHRIPADGLWLDIEYMENFKLFTFDKKHFADPPKEIGAIREQGFHVVPIIDPGIKVEEGYACYERFRDQGLLCKNRAGGDFIGLVWPHKTVFPDFTLDRCRKAWASEVAGPARQGIDGCWIDMNDPNTGDITDQDMLFENGRQPHNAYHNEYALLMAKATRRGFLEAAPDRRPFVLSRSGFTGSQKYAAHWNGDNYSNYENLKGSIATTLNLSLSGIPFNGPDVGGFGGDCTEQLLIDWVKAGFLFPFFRIHTCEHTRRQEPWAYSRGALRIIRSYLRLRYKFLPYLYNCFLAAAEHGDPVLRPLFYEFEDTKTELIDDQFLVGPSLMQAPFVEEGRRSRSVYLPRGRWLDWRSGSWRSGGRRITVRKAETNTPLFFREGACIPLQRGVAVTNRKNLFEVDLLCAGRGRGESTYGYEADDGESYAYRRGETSRYRITFSATGSGRGAVRIDEECAAAGVCSFSICTPTRLEGMTLYVNGAKKRLSPSKAGPDRTGMPCALWFWK